MKNKNKNKKLEQNNLSKYRNLLKYYQSKQYTKKI